MSRRAFFGLWGLVIIAMVAIELGLVWAHFHGEPHPQLEAASTAARYGRTAVCAGLTFVWCARAGRKEAGVLGAAALVCVIADYFLVLQGKLLIGLVFFAIAQVLWWVRGTVGLRLAWRASTALARHSAIRGVIIAVGVAALILAGLAPALLAKGLLLPVVVYACLVVGATATAFIGRACARIPEPYASRFAWGMLLFLIGDITVAIGAVGSESTLAGVVRAFTGVFYTPALLMLGSSGVPVSKAVDHSE